MKILLIGASGLLGRYLTRTIPKKYIVISGYRKPTAKLPRVIELDIVKQRSVQKAVKATAPQVIIHAASIGNVDYCQRNKEEAWRVNVKGTENILNAAKELGVRVIFFSSNAVFDGENSPYNEQSPVNPINFYGETKVAAEKLAMEYFPRAIIFRLTTTFGWNHPDQRHNPATWLIDRLKKKQKTPVVDDILNNHLWAAEAAHIVWTALKKEKFGEIFHIAGANCMNRFEFSKKVAEIFDLDQSLIYPVKSSHFKNLAPRPINTCFTTTKMEKLLGIDPLDISTGLRRMRNEIQLTKK